MPLLHLERTYALVVGVSDYADSTASPPCPSGTGPDLQFADDDANSFEHALKTVYNVPATNITKLLDCAATKAAIVAWLEDAATPTGSVNPTSGDDIIVFVAGHGVRAFCPTLGRVGNAILVNTATGLDVICDGELRSRMDSITAARKVVILDISFPSGFRNEFRDAANTLLITAARGEAREATFSSPDPCAPGHGIFTCWFVVRGILNAEANNPSLNPHTYDDPDVNGNEIPFEEAYDYTFHQAPPIQKPGIVDNVPNDFLPTE